MWCHYERMEVGYGSNKEFYPHILTHSLKTGYEELILTEFATILGTTNIVIGESHCSQ